VILGWRLLVA